MVQKPRLISLFALSLSMTTSLLLIALVLFTPSRSSASGEAPTTKTGVAEVGIPSLVKDIYTGPLTIGSDPDAFVESGGKLYFAAHDDTRGVELWLTDGSASGTRIVKDIIPGAGSSNPGPFEDVDGALFFRNSSDSALWKSDGTVTGTVRVFKFPEGGSIGAEMAPVNGRLYFVATEHSGEESQLWRSDGTLTSTVMVSRSLAGLGAQVGRQPVELTAGSKGLFYIGITDEGDETLFESDGTPGGSRALDVENPFGLHSAGATLYFSARDATHGNELWKSNGTPSGTVMVSDIFSGPNDSTVEGIVNISNTVYFSAQSEFGRRALWKSSGNTLNTFEVYWTPGLTPAQLTPVDDQLFFVDLNSGDLLASDGTPDGTLIVRHFSTVFNQYPDHLVALDGKLYFVVNDGADAGLWRSDGTPDGTVRVKEHTPSPQFESAGPPVAFEHDLYYKAWEAASGWELWQSDGTEGGTHLLANLAADIRSTFTDCPAWTSAADLLFFQVGCNRQIALWRSNGEITGTIPLITFTAESTFTQHFALTSFGNAAYLGYSGLWRSDGAVGGSQKITDINPIWFEHFDNELFMAASGGGTGVELWRSNGISTGTSLVVDINPGIPDGLGAEHAVAGNLLYFVADDGEHGAELWKSDGTKDGAALVKDIEDGPDGAQIHDLFGVGNRVYFLRTSADEGQELWTSDGTEEGTHIVRDIYPGEQNGVDSGPNFVGMDGILYFVANDGVHGKELWRSDGTETGTQLVRDIFPGPYSALPKDLVVFQGKLYFGAEDGAHGAELWRSDGTEAGTQLVADLLPGPDSSEPSGMTVVENELVFAANDKFNGYELWSSDGTAAGTTQVADIAPGAGASDPNDFHVAGQGLFFVANDGVTGNELWLGLIRTQQKGGTIYFPLLRQ